jgi:precorrin-6B C5,15-methyltransferase / cobalt-precorrin-6B C5,C15-methyltransferase
VIGIGADGWVGLSDRLRAVVLDAPVLLGGIRHLRLVPHVEGQERRAWPSPLREGLLHLLEDYDGQAIVVLASGDPLVSGVGSTLVELLGADRVRIEPAVSSVALARARMGWSAESSAVVSLVGRDEHLLLRELAPGRRLVVLSADARTPSVVASLLARHGAGASRMTVFGDLGSGTESRTSGTASGWDASAPELNVIAVEVDGPGAGWAAGLPDSAYEHDGQLTKRDARASALARLAPRPGELLWDVGAGAGSVAIEWMRAHATCRAVAVERDGARVERITRNAAALGVPGLVVLHAVAPDALANLPRPDAIFVGGGASVDGVIETCFSALGNGGRLVVHGVTLETEALLFAAMEKHGGELVRLSVEQAEPLGGFTGWTPARAITQWSVQR